MKTATINPKNNVIGSSNPTPASIKKPVGLIEKTIPKLEQNPISIPQKRKSIIASAIILNTFPTSKTSFKSFVNPRVPMDAITKKSMIKRSKTIMKNSSFANPMKS